MFATIILGQTTEITRSIAEYGVAVGVLIIILGAFLVGVRHVLMVSMPEQIKQLRDDHATWIKALREDSKVDREQAMALVHMQRQEFLAALADRDKLLRESMADRDQALKDAITRIEANCERAVARVLEAVNGPSPQKAKGG